MRVLRALVVVVVLAAAGFVVLKYVLGMRFELAGSGMRPIVSFESPEEHMIELEQERAVQSPVPALAPAEEPVVVQTLATEAISPPAPAQPPWPDYRGPKRDGVIEGVSIRTDWPLDEVWRTNVGGGYASMIVAEGKVYTIEQRRDQEVTAAYDLKTGREAWTHAWDAHFQEAMGGPGPRATPTYAGGRIYALGAAGDLRCLRASNGELLWKANILTDAGAENLQWGMAGAPLVTNASVIVQPGGRSNKSLAAYDAETGRLLWQSLSDQAGYTSPQLVTLAARPHVLTLTAHRLVAIDPADGAELWAVDWPAPFDINAAQPIPISENQVWISSGGGHGLIEVSGANGRLQATKAWESNRMKNKFNPSVAYQGHGYGLDDGILASVDLATGERNWKGGRYGFGQLLLADGHLIVLTERGELALVKATPESHQEIATFPALEGKTWNVPAYGDGLLLVRNQTEMAAYRLAR